MSIIGTRGILSGGTGTIASGNSEVVIVTDVTDPRYQPVVVVVGNDNSNVFLRNLTYAAGAWKFKVARSNTTPDPLTIYWRIISLEKVTTA